MVSIKSLSYSYPDGTAALKNISLDVCEGESVAVMGPNGAGKTTLLLHLNGLLLGDCDELKIMGMEVTKENLREIRSRVGLVFQNPDDQLFSSTVFDDVAFGPLNMGLQEEEVRERVREALEQVGMLGYEERIPHHLSFGEKKKISMATVLSMRPKILVIDEPTANLDPKSRKEFGKLLNQLRNDQKITLVVATHDVNFVPLISNRVYVLNKGKVVVQGSVKEIFSNLVVLEAANVEPPDVARLFHLLKKRKLIDDSGPLPLTVEEAFARLVKLLES